MSLRASNSERGNLMQLGKLCLNVLSFADYFCNDMI